MKQLFFACLFLPLFASAQTKFSQLPTVTADGNTSVVGLKYVSGLYTDYLFTLNSLAAYIGSVNPVPGLNNTLTSNPNTDKNINIGISNPFSSYAYKFVNIGLNATPDSTGYIALQDSLGNGITQKVTATHPKIVLSTASGNSTAVTDTQVNVTGGTIPLALNGATLYAQPGNTARDTVPYNTSGTFAFTSQLADTSSVLRGVINATVPGLNAVLYAGNVTAQMASFIDISNNATYVSPALVQTYLPGVSSVYKGSEITPGVIGFVANHLTSHNTLGLIPDSTFTPTTNGNMLTVPAWKSAPLALAGDNIAPGKTAGTGAGTSPIITFSTNSDDNSGLLMINIGTSPAGANATIATITFNTPFPGKAAVVLSPANPAAAGLYGTSQVYASCNYPATSFTIKTGTIALAASTTYSWNYVVMK